MKGRGPFSALYSNYWRLNFENRSISFRAMREQHPDKLTYRQTYRHTYIHTYRQTDRTKLLYRYWNIKIENKAAVTILLQYDLICLCNFVGCCYPEQPRSPLWQARQIQRSRAAVQACIRDQRKSL